MSSRTVSVIAASPRRLLVPETSSQTSLSTVFAPRVTIPSVPSMLIVRHFSPLRAPGLWIPGARLGHEGRVIADGEGRTDSTHDYWCSLVLIPNQNQSAAGVRERTRAIRITAQALHSFNSGTLFGPISQLGHIITVVFEILVPSFFPPSLTFDRRAHRRQPTSRGFGHHPPPLHMVFRKITKIRRRALSLRSLEIGYPSPHRQERIDYS